MFDLIREATWQTGRALRQSVFRRKPDPDLIRGGNRFASGKRVKKIWSPVPLQSERKGSCREQKLQVFNLLEDVMDTSTVPTFLACGAFFVLSFGMIWAFWFVERLRGASAPHVQSRPG